MVLAGCSSTSTSSVSTTTPSVHASGSPVAPGAPAANAGPDLSLFPAVATPFDQAPAALQTAWGGLGAISIIPGKDVFNSMPAVPTLANQTDGAVPDSDAQAWAVSLYREGALSIFAEAHGDAALLGVVQSEFATNVDVENTLTQGGTVSDPPCDQYPTRLVLRPVSEADRTFFMNAQQGVGSAKYIFVATYSATGTCATTGTLNGRTSTLYSFDNSVAVFLPGDPRDLGPLGTMFYVEALGPCQKAGAPADVFR